MANVRVYKATADSVLRAGVRVFAVSGGVLASAQSVRVFEVSVGLAPASSTVRVYRVGAAASTQVSAGPDQSNVEPHASVTLSAVGGSSPVWVQVSGDEAVALSGSGGVRSFRAPGSVAGDVLRFTVSDGGSSDSVDVSVKPHSAFVRSGGEWVDREVLVREAGAWA